MRTKIMSAVALCVVCVTGVAWAQSGPQPAVTGQANAQPSAANAQAAVDIGVAATKLVPTTFADRWVAVPGTSRTGAWFVFPKKPNSGPVKMSPRGDVFVSTAHGNGAYGFNPSLEGVAAHHIKLEIDAKRDRSYGISCHTKMVNKWAVRVSALPKLTLIRHGANGAALSANLFNTAVSTGPEQTDSTVHMGFFKHLAPDGKVELRITRSPGNGDHYIFLHRCAVSEETPTTTYKPAQGDKA